VGRFEVLALPIADWRSSCHVAGMTGRCMHLDFQSAPDRPDLSVLLREIRYKAVVFFLASLLSWGAPAPPAYSQDTTPATFSASEVEREFIEQAPRYRQVVLALPAERLARSYFAQELWLKSALPRAKAGVNVIQIINGTPQKVTKENVDAYIKGYSDVLVINDQVIRQRGYRQVGGTFMMNVGSNCEGFSDGTVSIEQNDFRIKLVSGWPSMFEKLARTGRLTQFEGIVIEETIAVGLPGDWGDVFGLGKVEAGRPEINFGKCRVTLTRR
jgi:hypothetical protein